MGRRKEGEERRKGEKKKKKREQEKKEGLQYSAVLHKPTPRRFFAAQNEINPIRPNPICSGSFIFLIYCILRAL